MAARGSPWTSLAWARRGASRGNGPAACLGRPSCLRSPSESRPATCLEGGLGQATWHSHTLVSSLEGGETPWGPNPESDFHCTLAFIRTLKQGPCSFVSVLLRAPNQPQPLPPEQRARKRVSESPLPGSLLCPSGWGAGVGVGGLLCVSTSCLLAFLTLTHHTLSSRGQGR